MQKQKMISSKNTQSISQKEQEITRQMIQYCQNRIDESGIKEGYYSKLITNLLK
jgi:hypothetical protein